MQNGRWYGVRIRIEGTRLEVWLDGKVLFDLTAAGGPANGQAFVGVSGGAANFAHLSVKSADGATLLAGVPTPARHWYAIGAGETALDTNLPLNSTQSLRMVSHDADSGIEQSGYAVRAGDALRGSLWLSGAGPGLAVRLLDGSKVLAEQAVAAPSQEGRGFPLLLNPSGTSGNATLRILARAHSDVKLDQVSLMPDSYRANGGFRTDLTQAVAALRPRIIRWPGGSFVGNYKWKDGIGPQSKRVGKNGWDEWDPLSFGIDEFLAFARKVGAEPAIVIWVGPRNKVDRAPMLQDAVDFVAYCNGPRDSAWGKIRAQNGHPEPYRVKYWEIDNEIWGMPAADYVDVLGQFVPAMKKVDPAIRTIASGSGSEVLEISRRGDRQVEESETQALRVGVERAEHGLAHRTVRRRHSQCHGARRRRGHGDPGALPAPRDGALLGQRADQLRPAIVVPGAELRGDEAVSRSLRAGLAAGRRQPGRPERYCHAHRRWGEDLRQAGQPRSAGSLRRGRLARRFPADDGEYATGGAG